MQWSEASRPYGDSRSMWAGVEVWISNSTDTQAWIAVRACATSGSGYDAAYEYGVVTQAGHAAAANRGAEWNEAGRGVLNAADIVADRTIVYGPFDRYSSAYSVTCWCKAWGDTVDGYGGWDGGAESYVAIAVPALPVYAPNAVGSISNTRNSDNQNTVSWANATDTTHPYASLLVERRIDGGSWSQIASLSGSATSYADAGAQANHAYTYRVRPYNASGYGAYATSGTTYNTPAAPSSVTATRSGSNTVGLAIDNSALTATALSIQRSTDGSAWSDVSTVAGSAITTATDAPGGGTFYYRARNTRGSLVSAWSPASNAVVTIVAPAAPTLLSPTSGVTVAKTQMSIVFGWRHNPIDGSAQTAAQLQYSTDGGTTWTTVSLATAQTHSLDNEFAVNATVTWRVRTKGAYADYGAYSASQAFSVCQVPSIAVKTPASDNTTITDVPITIAWSYDDQSGTQRQAAVSIKDSAGSVLWSKAIAGPATSLSVPSTELLPANNASFSIEVAATSTSGLAATAQRVFTTAYKEPAKPGLSIEVDKVRGSVSLVVYEGAASGTQPPTASLGIFRRNSDGSLKSLVDKSSSGTGVVDICPPLDQDGMAYVAVAYTGNGLTATTEHPVVVPSDGSIFVNFDAAKEYADVAKLTMDAEWETETEVDSEVIETEGAEDPLVFFGISKRMESKISGTSWWTTAPIGWGNETCMSAAFERLAEDVGIKIVRYPHGPVVPSRVTCRVKISSSNPLVASVELDARRVRADGLLL